MDSIKEKCLSSKNNSLENSVVYGYDIKVVRNGYLNCFQLNATTKTIFILNPNVSEANELKTYQKRIEEIKFVCYYQIVDIDILIKANSISEDFVSTRAFVYMFEIKDIQNNIFYK